MRKIKGLCIIFLTLLSFNLFADEGMWFPQLLQQLNETDMRLKGLEISAAEIYNVNSNSIKDAVVQFGGGCTAEIISSQGLILTNDHCGNSFVQDKSSLEHNYLKNGFWSESFQEELPCKGLTVTFVVSINDVTTEFNKLFSEGMSEQKRNDIIKELSYQLEKRAVEGTKYDAKVRQFFSGNEFYLIKTQTFKDIRLVGFPPLSIGRFGGDTDNWMWPSHTGDFSLFRIYADKNNNPSDYSSENIPYKPKYSFPINLNGIKENDFTMVYGFPGKTEEYISSYALELLLKITDPDKVKVREERLKIIQEAMRSSEEIHIQYAAKESRISNPWKKWKGEMLGLEHSQALKKKRDFEADFQKWTQEDSIRKMKYGNVLSSLNKIYSDNSSFLKANDFYTEAAFGIEIINYAKGFSALMEHAASDTSKAENIKAEAANINRGTADYFKNYNLLIDQQTMSAMLRMFDSNVEDSLKPGYFTDMRKRYRGDLAKWSAEIFKKSIFSYREKINQVLSDFTSAKAKTIKKDPAYILFTELSSTYKLKIAVKAAAFVNAAAILNRIYMEGQREMQPGKKFYPDANSTLRLSYGQVRGYAPKDGVIYNFQTTLEGVMEKYIPGDLELDVPVKLRELYNAKDYGRYGSNGTLPLTFIATNHTTGGNSGSPVLNSKGQLIGTNYDRVWEGTMSDVLFNPEICRNISLDIRYTLFIIDKYAGAQRLIDEMNILK